LGKGRICICVACETDYFWVVSESKKVCVVMGDDRPVREGAQTATSYPSLAYEINRRFCASKNWDFRYECYGLPSRPWGSWSAYSRSARQHRAASWVKIFAVLRALELGYEFVIWIDSDCIFYNHSADWSDVMESFDRPELQFLSWVDRPFYHDQFCAGFFIVRSSEAIQRLLCELWTQPSDYSWKHVYEQSELNSRIKCWSPAEYTIIDEPMFRLEVEDQRLLHLASFDHQKRIPGFADWFAQRSIKPEALEVKNHVFTDLLVDQWDQKLGGRALTWIERLGRDVWSMRQAIRRSAKRAFIRSR
jgi:hypothetical protein